MGQLPSLAPPGNHYHGQLLIKNNVMHLLVVSLWGGVGWEKEVSCIPKESDKIALPSSSVRNLTSLCNFPASGTLSNLVMGTFEIQTITGLP